jgi:protein-S-isoprenylcysteine O-methyltransferase Ste14
LDGSFPVVTMLVCWVAVVLVWLAGAVYNARRGSKVSIRSRSRLHLLLLLTIPTTYAVQTVAPIRRPIFAACTGVTVTALVALPLCAAFTIWARLALGTMWSATPTAREGHRLRTRGPYAITRHPIYTGLLGMLLCTALITRQGWSFAVLVFAGIAMTVKSGAEERILREVFPGHYDDYRAAVPRLLPWPRRPIPVRYPRSHRAGSCPRRSTRRAATGGRPEP